MKAQKLENYFFEDNNLALIECLFVLHTYYLKTCGYPLDKSRKFSFGLFIKPTSARALETSWSNGKAHLGKVFPNVMKSINEFESLGTFSYLPCKYVRDISSISLITSNHLKCFHDFISKDLFTPAVRDLYYDQKFDVNSLKVINLWSHIDYFKSSIQPSLRWVYYLICKFNDLKFNSSIKINDQFVSLAFYTENVPRQFASDFNWPSNLMKLYHQKISDFSSAKPLSTKDYADLILGYKAQSWSKEREADIKLLKGHPIGKKINQINIGSLKTFSYELKELSIFVESLSDSYNDIYSFNPTVLKIFQTRDKLQTEIQVVSSQLHKWIRG